MNSPICNKNINLSDTFCGYCGNWLFQTKFNKSEFDSGFIEKNSYHSVFFGFSMDLPINWVANIYTRKVNILGPMFKKPDIRFLILEVDKWINDCSLTLSPSVRIIFEEFENADKF
jgi:hypothetical protein